LSGLDLSLIGQAHFNIGNTKYGEWLMGFSVLGYYFQLLLVFGLVGLGAIVVLNHFRVEKNLLKTMTVSFSREPVISKITLIIMWLVVLSLFSTLKKIVQLTLNKPSFITEISITEFDSRENGI